MSGRPGSWCQAVSDRKSPLPDLDLARARGLFGAPGGAYVGVSLKHQGPPSWSCCCMPGLLHSLPDLVPPCVLLLTYLSRGLLRARRTIPTTCCVKRGNSPPFKKLQCFLVEVWLIYNVNSRCAAKSVSCIYMHIYIFFFLYHFPLWFITEY